MITLFSKKIFLICLLICCLITTSLAAPNKAESLKKDLKSLHELFSENAPNEKIEKYVFEMAKRQQLVGELSLLGNDTPEAMRLALAYGNVLREHEDMLLEISFNKVYRSSTVMAHRYLWLMPPSEHYKQKLLHISKDHPYAYEILFRTRQFDDEVKQKFLDTILQEPSQRERDTLASLATPWAIEEMLPIYEEMLNRPFLAEYIEFKGHMPLEDPKSNITGHKTAARYVKRAGPSAAKLLPLLRMRIEEITTKFPTNSELLVSTLKEAVKVAEGTRAPDIELAYNPPGRIDLRSGSTDSIPNSENTKSTKFDNTDSGNSNLISVQTSAPVKENIPNRWLIIAGSTAFLAGLLYYIIASKRKS